MKGISRKPVVKSSLVLLAAVLVFSLVLVPQTSLAQAAVDWTRHPDPVYLEGERYVGDASVIWDAAAGKYKMWFTHGKTDLDVTKLIGGLADLGFGKIIDAIADLDLPKLLRHIGGLDARALLDFVDATSTVIGYAESTDGITWYVIESEVTGLAGGSGAWKSVGAPSVIKDGDIYKMWYTRSETDLTEEELGTLLTRIKDRDIGAVLDLLDATSTVIGYATSTNRTHWTAKPLPVLAGDGPVWDSVGAPSVIKTGDLEYKMWFTRSTTDVTEVYLKGILYEGIFTIDNLWAILDRTRTVIGYAESTDGGKTWPVPNRKVVLDKGVIGAVGDSVGAPSVIKDGTTYEMWYTRSVSDFDQGKLGALLSNIATLELGKFVDDLVAGDLGALLDAIATLHLRLAPIQDDLANTSTVIAYATSNDGKTWEVVPAPQLVGVTPALWSSVAAPSVVKIGEIYKMWFTQGIPDLTVSGLLGLLDGTFASIGHAYTPRYTLTVTVHPAASGTVSLSPEPGPDGKYLVETEVTLAATPAAGWEFDHWSGDVTGTEPTITLTMVADKSVTAHFAVPPVVVPPPVVPPPVVPPTVEELEVMPVEEAAEIIIGLPLEEAAELMEEVAPEIAAAIIEEVAPEIAADIIEEVAPEIAAAIIEEVAPEIAADIIEEVAPEIAAAIIEEVAPEIAVDIIEEVATETAVEIVDTVDIETAVEIAEGVDIERAVEITEGLSIQRAIKVAERVSIERAVDIAQEVSVERAAEIVDKVVIERAVEIVEGVDIDRAAEIIEEVSHMPGTIDRAVEILEKASLERATEIIERLSIETAVEIVRRLSIETASEIIKGVPLERAMEILTVIEKVYPEIWKLLPKPILEPRDLSIEPLEVAIGEEVTISVEAANVGQITGKRLITLKVAEVVVETQEVELAPGETTRVEFKVVKMEPGIYPVEIDGLIGEFTVVVPPAPTIEKVVPDSGVQGATIDAVITGEHFAGATAVSFGEVIAVNWFTVITPTQIEANISIAADARAGPRDVSVTTPGGTGILHGGFTVRDIIPPRVVATSPEAGATRVPVDVRISVTFSEDMDAATINTATFILIADAIEIPGRVTYDPATRTATFIPYENLAYGTVYTATITTGARDLAGNGLAQEFSWSFTTRPEPIDLVPIIEGAVAVARVIFTIALIIYAFVTLP